MMAETNHAGLPAAGRSYWSRCWSWLLDRIYPPACALCSAPLSHGKSLCRECAADLPRLREPFCKRCGEMFDGKIDGPFTCPNCEGMSLAYDFARPALERDPRTLDLVHRLKYNREIHLAPELAALAAESFADPRLATALDHGWPLVPVPIHRKRLRHRHFNQAMELCLPLARQTGLPVLDALERSRETGTQTRLTRKQRMENLRTAFALTREGRDWLALRKDGVILVDDVLTTGSTVNECARTLRKAGFRSVIAITVMRG